MHVLKQHGRILQVRQQCPGGLQLQLVEENDNDKVHSAANVHSNPKEQRDEVEQQGKSPVEPRTPFITTGVGLVGLWAEGGQMTFNCQSFTIKY